jgi:hypothetical protein
MLFKDSSKRNNNLKLRVLEIQSIKFCITDFVLSSIIQYVLLQYYTNSRDSMTIIMTTSIRIRILRLYKYFLFNLSERNLRSWIHGGASEKQRLVFSSNLVIWFFLTKRGAATSVQRAFSIWSVLAKYWYLQLTLTANGGTYDTSPPHRIRYWHWYLSTQVRIDWIIIGCKQHLLLYCIRQITTLKEASSLRLNLYF